MKLIKEIKKKRIGLAYSGGLDTRAALKWMNLNKNKVYTFFGDTGNVKKKKIKIIKKEALLLGAKEFYLINCKKKILKEGMKLLKCRAFNVYSGTGIYFNTTPISRAVMGVLISKEMKKKNIKIWSDGSTYKGNDIERFFRYSYIVNKDLKIYKPWFDPRFIKKMGGRKEMSKYIGVIDNKKYNYSIDSNILGNTYEGGEIENLKFDITKIYFIMCKNIKKVKKKSVFNIEFKNGSPYKFNKKKINSFISFFKEINRISSKHKLGLSDQIEERIIGTKSRGIYEAPGMYLLHNVYERFISCIYNRSIIELYRNNGYSIGKLLYNGKWFDEETEIRKKISIMITKKINGYIEVMILNNNVFYLNTKIKNNKYLKDNSSMEKVKNESFDFNDRIGYLNIKKVSIDLNYFKKKI
ncbi:argininosuccinate synthase [Candidatus Vidania fulgoroideorum]